MADMGISIDGIDDCLRAFSGLQGDLRKAANGELRRAAAAIGREVVIPGLGGSGSPQEGAILAAAGPKSDRYVVVAVPSRKPALSGVKRTSAAEAKRLGFALEGGSDYAPFHKPVAGSVVRRNRDKIARAAIPRYTSALVGIMRKWGLL
jgi:hypothetical protein